MFFLFKSAQLKVPVTLMTVCICYLVLKLLTAYNYYWNSHPLLYCTNSYMFPKSKRSVCGSTNIPEFCRLNIHIVDVMIIYVTLQIIEIADTI